MVQGLESKGGEEEFHSRKTVLPSGQHASCGQGRCLAEAGHLWSACHASEF